MTVDTSGWENQWNATASINSPVLDSSWGACRYGELLQEEERNEDGRKHKKILKSIDFVIDENNSLYDETNFALHIYSK